VISVRAFIDTLGLRSPWLLLALFIVSSLLLIWRLEHMTKSGIEGTVLGTLVMPYCSGIGNLIFVFVVGRSPVAGTEVMTNCLVNNVTNMTLLIGLPTLFWGMSLLPKAKTKAKSKAKPRKKKQKDQEHRINRLSLLLTLTAVLFFTGALWALGRDGRITITDGLVLVGLFLFWQCFHVFDVLKSNVRQNKSLNWMVAIDFLLLLVGAGLTYISIDGLVSWLSRVQSGFISAKNLGWLSGWLMVVPNGLLALYYGWQGKPEVVYTSQVGDGHICIPLCVGLYSLINPIVLPAFFEAGVLILAVATVVHIIFVSVLGGLPRWMGWVMAAAYLFFLYRGLIR
jgi:cation:H+ antiporter